MFGRASHPDAHDPATIPLRLSHSDLVKHVPFRLVLPEPLQGLNDGDLNQYCYHSLYHFPTDSSTISVQKNPLQFEYFMFFWTADLRIPESVTFVPQNSSTDGFELPKLQKGRSGISSLISPKQSARASARVIPEGDDVENGKY